MATTRNWQEWRDTSARLLKERSSDDVNTWKRRIKQARLADEKRLRASLRQRGVTGYAQSLQQAYDENS